MKLFCDHIYNIVDHVHNRVDHVHNCMDHVLSHAQLSTTNKSREKLMHSD